MTERLDFFVGMLNPGRVREGRRRKKQKQKQQQKNDNVRGGGGRTRACLPAQHQDSASQREKKSSRVGPIPSEQGRNEKRAAGGKESHVRRPQDTGLP